LGWSPAICDMYSEPPRPWEPFPTVAARLAAWKPGADVVVVDSIPSGVLGVARYADPRTPIVSWVVRLGGRRLPDDAEVLLADHRRVALVKTHLLGEPSTAEEWLRGHTTLHHEEKIFAEQGIVETTDILYFVTGKSADRCESRRRAWNG